MDDATKARAELTALLDAFAGDVSSSDRALSAQPDSQPFRRAYVRSVFATLEGMTFCLKQDGLATAARDAVHLSDGERALLQEKSFGLRENGEAQERATKLRLEANMRFAFRTFAKLHHIESPTLDASPEWVPLRARWRFAIASRIRRAAPNAWCPTPRWQA